jgi:quercetin dioxygenase-like cupin family protein
VNFSFSHDQHGSAPILIPAIGSTLTIRLPPEATGGQLTIFETVNASGFGPPLHRHREIEIFHVTRGCYLFEVDGRRFRANIGDVICVRQVRGLAGNRPTAFGRAAGMSGRLCSGADPQ